MPLLFNPATYDPAFLDDESRTALRDLVSFFEAKGKDQMQAEHNAAAWYDDFLQFCAERNLLGMMGTPSAVGRLLGGEEGAAVSRWDTGPDQRVQRDPRLLLAGPLVRLAGQRARPGPGLDQRKRREPRPRSAKLLDRGRGLRGSGCPRREHGADIYSTDMILTRVGDGWERHWRQVLHRQRQRRRPG